MYRVWRSECVRGVVYDHTVNGVNTLSASLTLCTWDVYYYILTIIVLITVVRDPSTIYILAFSHNNNSDCISNNQIPFFMHGTVGNCVLQGS